ncbi:hypothetical protein GCM10010446_25780 [Streptomyces enissocaesilis]|uniref:Uncharacterized protein n=1 Tax=Streptomyces enissocaesilis TaxID=332589 RepID=A0ABN3X6A9_9ACTN
MPEVSSWVLGDRYRVISLRLRSVQRGCAGRGRRTGGPGGRPDGRSTAHAGEELRAVLPPDRENAAIHGGAAPGRHTHHSAARS